MEKHTILYRSKEYVEGMILANRLIKRTLDYLTPFVQEGQTTAEIALLANDFFVQHGARSATLGYRGYPAAICTSVNEVICHGIPNNDKLQTGDILNVDVSCILNGYYGDASRMFEIGKVSQIAHKLVKNTEECLAKGIQAVRPWQAIGDIGAAIQKHAHSAGFSVVEQFVGHAIGRAFHEEYLQVPHFGKKGCGPLMLPGMFFTIEPMINEGVKEAVVLEDEWTAVTLDRKLSAQFEHTLLVTPTGYRVLTDETDDVPLWDEQTTAIVR